MNQSRPPAPTSEAFRLIDRARYRFSQAKLGFDLLLRLFALFAKWLNRLEERQELTERRLGTLAAEIALLKDPPSESDSAPGE